MPDETRNDDERALRERVVEVLEEMATILELAGANTFEIMAYRNGALNLDDFDGDLAAAVRDKTLREIPGVGKGLEQVVTELVEQGHSTQHAELRSRFPESLYDLLSVPGLGAKKIRRLHEELGILGLDDLEQAANDERIREMRGFGKKSEERILSGIERARRWIAKRRESET